MDTTREDLIAELSALEQWLAHRVAIVRIIVDDTGNEIGRLYRGEFISPGHSRTSESPRAGGETLTSSCRSHSSSEATATRAPTRC